MSSSNNKAQVSIFIIVGVVLVFIVGIGIYVATNSGDSVVDSAVTSTLEHVPDAIVPFKLYADTCLSDTLHEALIRAGTNGGEIYSREFRSYNFMNPALSDGIELFPGGDLTVPYWVHVEGDALCLEGCNRVIAISPLTGPSPNTVQSQVERYIQERIPLCFPGNSFLDFTYEAMLSPRVSVTFADNGVSAVLDYPFELRRHDDIYEISEFRAESSIPFKQYYEKATYLAALAYESDFLSKATLQWINLYSGMDNNLLPSMAGTNLDFVSDLLWTTFQIEDGLQNIIRRNLPLFTVQSSMNFASVESDSYFNVVYQNYELPATDFENVAVSFQYHDWPLFIDINNGRQVIRPESASFAWFPFFGINRLRTMYSVRYPVMVSLSNPDDDFIFNFALQSNVLYNDVIPQQYQAFTPESFSSSASQSRLCDVRSSEPVSLRLFDGQTLELLNNSYLSFTCGDENCAIANLEGGVFSDALPVCTGGELHVLMPGYETTVLDIDPSIDRAIDLGDITIEPFRTKNISFRRLMYRKNAITGEWYLDNAIDPDSREKIIIQLERIDDGHTIFGVFENGEGTMSQILPGTYTARITSTMELFDAPLRFLPQERCVNIIGSLVQSCYDIPEEIMEIDQYLAGGAIYDQSTRTIAITRDLLDQSNTIEFRTFFMDLLSIPEDERVIEDLEVIGMHEELSVMHAQELSVRFR
ncbi:MAG: hypothetical protein ACMXYK_00730 [Candidatus Woesearchaeota archaeon]